jgi:hypothetical protein
MGYVTLRLRLLERVATLPTGMSDKWFDVEWFDSERGADDSMHEF